MKLMHLFIAPALALAVGTAYADTSTSNKGKATMEKNAYPSAKKQDEERTQAHSQPDGQKAGGTKPRKAAGAKNKSSKSGASVGSSASKDHGRKTEQSPR